MSEAIQTDHDDHPGEENYVHDPVQAELMAYAEKPHREYAIALRDAANGEITDQLEEYYQKNPDHRQITWEQKDDRKYRERDDLLSGKKEFLAEADKAVARGIVAAWRVSKKYRQDKES